MIGVIGGTGFDSLEGFEEIRRDTIDTPWGPPSAPIIRRACDESEFVFLARHGEGHTIAPHKINYRANLAALKLVGVSNVVALTAVGGIHPTTAPGSVVLPDQLVDYTWGRDHTFYDGEPLPTWVPGDTLEHIDFSRPFSEPLRKRLKAAADTRGVKLLDGGVCGVTQGPRLETAAEIDRLDTDGADLVGMTAMPEAALARELGMDYAVISMVVNAAAGRSEDPINMEVIHCNLELARKKILPILEELIGTV